MKKLFLSIVSVMTAVAVMVLPASAAFELDGVQAKERNPGVTEQNEVLSMSREIENPIRFEIPCTELNLMQYTNDDTPKQGKEILNDALIAEMKKINPDFETEYYSVFYNPSGGLLFLSKVIPTEYRNVFVGVGYSIYIEKDVYKRQGVFLINCQWTPEELNEHMPADAKRYIAKNNIQLYTCLLYTSPRQNYSAGPCYHRRDQEWPYPDHHYGDPVYGQQGPPHREHGRPCQGETH